MTGYYEDDDKLTFDRAGVLVERYIRERHHQVTRVTSKDVAREYDIEESHHNLIRLNDALDERLEVTRESGSKATQYKVEIDAIRTGKSDSRQAE